MPSDPSIYGQQQSPRINTPFESLGAIMQLRNQQQAAQGLAEQRRAAADKSRQEAEQARQEAAAATALRAEFNRVDPATGQPIPPDMNRVAGIIGPEPATNIFKGFEALRTQRSNNAKDDTARIAAVLGGVEAMPGDLKAQAYAGARQQLIADGTLKPGQAPATYDANFVKAKRREALSVLEQFNQDKPPADYTLGDARMSGATNQPIATATPKPAALGSEQDFITRWAADRKLDPAKLSASQVAAAKQAKARAEQAPSQAQPAKPSYEWANVGGENKLLTPEEIRTQRGTKPMTAMEAMDERKYKKAAPVLAGIGELSEKINTQQGLLAKMSGGASKLAAKANYDDDVAEYQALVSGFTPMVARALGHTGVLTQQDVDSVRALFPLPGDSKTLRDRKMTRMLGIISDLEGATSAPAAGRAAPAAKPPANETPEQRLKRLIGGG